MFLRSTATALLLGVAACHSAPTPRIVSGLEPGGRAEVSVLDASRVVVENLGPGRLRVRFLDVEHVAVWVGAGGSTVVKGRRDRRVELRAAAGHATRFRVVGPGASGIALIAEE